MHEDARKLSRALRTVSFAENDLAGARRDLAEARDKYDSALVRYHNGVGEVEALAPEVGAILRAQKVDGFDAA